MSSNNLKLKTKNLKREEGQAPFEVSPAIETGLPERPRRSGPQTGQVMLLTVIVMATVFLSVTAIAGTLMVYQLSQVAKVVDSAKSIFAADAGIERGLFAVFRCNPTTPVFPSAWQAQPPLDIIKICDSARNQIPTGVTPPFVNGATYKMEIRGNAGQNQNTPPNQVDWIRATGSAGKSARAFEILF
ncbi:MAG: hypothetical protein AAB518_01775 [Patescibacteria group bacterium]